MNKFDEAIDYIRENDLELKAIERCLRSHALKHATLHGNYSDAKNSLQAIHKINASDNQNKKNAIDALSEGY